VQLVKPTIEMVDIKSSKVSFLSSSSFISKDIPKSPKLSTIRIIFLIITRSHIYLRNRIKVINHKRNVKNPMNQRRTITSSFINTSSFSALLTAYFT
ncbi:hypothetical protein BS583_15535, partial [Acinetobacter baumannii]